MARCSFVAMVGEGVNGYTPARREYTFDLNVAWLHKPDEVFHYDVHAVLMKVAVIAEREQI